MTDPRIVTPEEAKSRLGAGQADGQPFAALLLHTVATEPGRTRAAVVKALRHYGDAKAYRIAAEIENGAPFDA